MKTKYSTCLLSSLFLLAIVGGCKKYVKVDAPVNQLATTSVFNDDNSAIAAQLAVYTQMDSDPATLDKITALSSDEITPYSSDQTSRDLYTNALVATKDATGIGVWTNAYKYIYQENAILENVQNSTGISTTVKGLLIGEAKFVRAFWYFYLVNLYGDVPLVVSTDYTQNSFLAKSPKADVYQQMVSDLTYAKNLLSSNYLDATDTTITVDRVRPTTWAASALLARVYLYTGKYDSSELQSSIVLGNTTLFSLPLNLNDVFKKNSSETIWQILPTNSFGATREGVTFVLNTKPSSANNGITASSSLLNAFEKTDNRKSSWIGTYTDGTNNWSFLNKYKYKTTPGSLNEYSMVFRLAEQYLIRSEARAKQNKLSDAINDLNKIRVRAGLAGVNASFSQQQILDAIVHERQVELFGEAQRWLDLKRLGMVDAVMSNAILQKGGANWNSYQQFYPIIVADIQRNINLVQNQGY